MDQLLNDFSPGLFIMQAIILLVLILLLRKLAWKPIISALDIREATIVGSLEQAEKAQAKIEQLKADNESLLQEARLERDKILKDASEVASKIKEEAKGETAKTTAKMIEDAKATIVSEKKAALSEIRGVVAELSLEIAEKVLKKNLKEDKAQQELVADLIKDIKVN